MKKKYESKEMPEKCPKCGAPVYRILYGLPAMSEEDYFKKYHEYVIYGGCCISEDGPEWACSKCGTEIYREKQVPRRKKDAFARLDAQFNEEEKGQIAKADSIKLHFSLGMWIRNNWIYQQDEEDVKHLAELFGEDSPFFQADDLSGRIIESYQRHLRAIRTRVVQ